MVVTILNVEPGLTACRKAAVDDDPNKATKTRNRISMVIRFTEKLCISMYTMQI